MYRAPEHQVDDSAVGAVGRIFTDELGWMFARNEVREYGIDGHAQAVRGDGQVTGRMLATQVRGSGSRFRRPAADGSGWEFWSDSKHLHYWLGYHVPVLVVLVRPGDGAACSEPSPVPDAAYKHREDLIDALLCAWTASLWARHGFSRCQVLGLSANPSHEPGATIIGPARHRIAWPRRLPDPRHERC